MSKCDHWVICDVCGFKVKASDAVYVQGKYNRQNGLLVCSKDVDRTHPQDLPIKPRPEKPIDPRYLRPRQQDRFVFISEPSEIETGDLSDPAGRVPDAPNLSQVVPVSETSIELTWNFTEPFKSPGSSAPSGYKIERESPVGGGFAVLVANTGNSALYYKDTGLSSGTQYNYRISAINTAGTGSASNEKDNTTL